ncbi:MAG: phosphotransferase [Acidimicrobiia bacterium]|nr:phosphotransferase [Acidimicrobiia bacterium]
MNGSVVPVEEAEAFLRARYGRVDDVARLGGGDWSQAFGFSAGGQELVARFGLWREDFEKDDAAMAFGGPDLPVPRLLEIGDAFDGAYAISERHHGTFLEELDATGFERVLPAVLRGLDAMRAVPTAPDARPEPWAEWLLDLLVDRPGDRVSGWRWQLAAMPELDRLFEAGRAALAEVLPACPDLQHVLHLDLLNRNVLVDADRARLEAVFDWGCLSYGDFLYEVAWFTFWTPWHAGLRALDVRRAVLDHHAAIGLEVPDFDARLRCYELHIGLMHLAYNAFAPGRAAELEATAVRLDALL